MRTANGKRLATVLAVLLLSCACSSGSAHRQAAARRPSAPASSSPVRTVTTSPSRPRHAVPSQHVASARRSTARRSTATPRRHPIATASDPPPRRHAAALPLHLRTGDARQVITVTAPSTASTHGTLQTWRKVAGGWRRVGPAVYAWLGSAGLTRHASESRSATPIGSFTLTRAFGRYADPGTALPYRQTTPDDWWISQPGPLYNTFQHCAGNCAFRQGDPNEHLYFTMPYYRYAVVIDYNTRNAPGGVVQGAGSAFFLHVTVGEPTQGCVSVDQGQLIRVMRWLSPARHPRILIGIRS